MKLNIGNNNRISKSIIGTKNKIVNSDRNILVEIIIGIIISVVGGVIIYIITK